MAAATRPIASLFEGGVCEACSMAWPPISTWTASVRALGDEVDDVLDVGLGDRLGQLGEDDGGVGRLAVAADLGGAGRAVGTAHRGHRRRRGNLLQQSPAMWVRTAGSLTEPVRTCQTIGSESPDCFGRAELSRLSALADSVPGRVKVFE